MMGTIDEIRIVLTEEVYRDIEILFQIMKIRSVIQNKLSDSSEWIYDIILDFSEDDGYFFRNFYNVLRTLDRRGHSDGVNIIIKTRKYQITDIELQKLLLDNIQDNNFFNVVSLSRVVKDEKISSFSELEDLIKQPFSGFMLFDYFDANIFFSDYACIEKDMYSAVEAPQNYESCDRDILICNRYIPEGVKLNFKRNKSVIFNNCVIRGEILLSKVEKVDFVNCITSEKVKCVKCKELSFSECNMHELEIYNLDIMYLNISWSNIYSWVMRGVKVEKFTFFENRITNPILYDIKLPRKDIDMKQFNKLLSTNIKDEVCQSFYFNFRLYDLDKTKENKEETIVRTIDSLLEYGDFNNDFQGLAKLKYKKVLYSNKGLSRFFVLITGGFYKPWIWLMYLTILILVFSVVYMLPICNFILTSQEGVECLVRLELEDAFQYSVLQIFSTNIFKYTPRGVAEFLTVVQSALSTMLIANYFAALVKKYL